MYVADFGSTGTAEMFRFHQLSAGNSCFGKLRGVPAGGRLSAQYSWDAEGSCGSEAVASVEGAASAGSAGRVGASVPVPELSPVTEASEDLFSPICASKTAKPMRQATRVPMTADRSI